MHTVRPYPVIVGCALAGIVALSRRARRIGADVRDDVWAGGQG